jgi:hypothetical protein
MEKNILHSFSIKLQDINPLCQEHKSPYIAICINPNCHNLPVCVNCLIINHFKDHDQNNLIPIKEYLDKVDEYFLSKLGHEENINLMEIKTTLLDVLENFKYESDEIVESMKKNIFNEFSQYEEPNTSINISDRIYSSIIIRNDPIQSLMEELSKLEISFDPKKRKFGSTKTNSEKDKILKNLEINQFLEKLEDIIKGLKKKLTVFPSTFSFKTFNLSDDNVIKITETPEGINFKKIGSVATTYLVISNEHLDFSKIIIWRLKPINLPNRWMGIGILPRDKYKREGWNSTDLIGLNCDKYFLDRGNNQSGSRFEVTTQSVLTFTLNGPEFSLKIENCCPKFEITVQNLEPRLEYCLALFLHYPSSEIILMK